MINIVESFIDKDLGLYEYFFFFKFVQYIIYYNFLIFEFLGR